MINFIHFLGTFLYAYVMICCYNATLDCRKKFTTREYIIIGIISLIMVINNLYNINIFKMLCSLVIIASLFFLVFRETKLILLYKIIFISIISIFTDFIISICVSVVHDGNILNTHFLLKAIINIVSSFAMYFLFKSKFISSIYSKLHSLLYQSKNLVFIIGLMLIVVGYNYYIYTLNYRDIYFYMISLFLITFLFCLSYYYFKQIYDNKLLKLKDKYLEDNLKVFQNAFNDYQELKHNIINDFLFIKSINNRQNQKLIDLKMEKYYKDSERFDLVKDIPSGFQGLIYAKTVIAKRQKINFLISSKINNYNYKKLDYKTYINLCETLGIVIDNAIEAAKEAKEKSIYLTTCKNAQGIIINIFNSFNNEIDLNRLGEKNYSTKPRKSGVGLNYLKKLNENIKIKREIINSIFKTTIIVQEK